MFVKNSIHPDVLRYPHPILKADKLKKGAVRQFAILGKSYVLFRDAEGKAAATLGNCPRRGALLAKGSVNAHGELVCAYHTWRIRSNNTAVSPSNPNKVCSIPMRKTWEKHGFIRVAHADVPDSAFPDFTRPGFQFVGGFTSRSGCRCQSCWTTSARSSTPSRCTFLWGRGANHRTRCHSRQKPGKTRPSDDLRPSTAGFHWSSTASSVSGIGTTTTSIGCSGSSLFTGPTTITSRTRSVRRAGPFPTP
jgi:nitrite reductase/ring-hydroxylating ferredoxin subunit